MTDETKERRIQEERRRDHYLMLARIAELEATLRDLLNAIDGNRLTQGDCNQARAVLVKNI